MNYRRDNRTKEQFAKDIKKAHRIERQLMAEYVEWLNKNRRDDNPYEFIDHGCDNSGKLIEDDEKVDCRADFLLRRSGKPDRKIEIKYCLPDNYKRLKRYNKSYGKFASSKIWTR